MDLSSGISVIIFVIISHSKLFRIRLLNLFIRHTFTDALHCTCSTCCSSVTHRLIFNNRMSSILHVHSILYNATQYCQYCCDTDSEFYFYISKPNMLKLISYNKYIYNIFCCSHKGNSSDKARSIFALVSE